MFFCKHLQTSPPISNEHYRLNSMRAAKRGQVCSDREPDRRKKRCGNIRIRRPSPSTTRPRPPSSSPTMSEISSISAFRQCVEIRVVCDAEDQPCKPHQSAAANGGPAGVLTVNETPEPIDAMM
jgi:hypothetical protein